MSGEELQSQGFHALSDPFALVGPLGFLPGEEAPVPPGEVAVAVDYALLLPGDGQLGHEDGVE